MAVEYPGYGVYKNENGEEDESANADRIIRDAETVYKFLTETVKWNESDIIICGRSIGSGPACRLASNHKPAALVLVSPHTSIRGVVKD